MNSKYKEIQDLNLEEARTRLGTLRLLFRASLRDPNYTMQGRMGIAENTRYILKKFPQLKN